MNKKLADRIFALVLLALVLVFMAMGLQLSVTARRMPLIVGTFTLICLIAYFVGEFWPRGGAQAKVKTEKRPSEAASGEASAQECSPASDALNWYDWRVWGWLLVLFVCIFFAGLNLGLGLLTALFYRFGAKGSWKGALLFAILQMVFLYLVFELGFREELYRGFIYERLVG